MTAAEFQVLDTYDPDDTDRRIGVTVLALDQAVGISNTTERALRIVVGGEERVLCPSPRRDQCIVHGVLLWRVGPSFDFLAVGEPHLVEPVELDALCAELVLPGGAPCVH